MKNFDWDKFMQGKFVVYCGTKEKADDFLRTCHNKGMNWIDGEENDDNLLNYSYEKNICYKHYSIGLWYDNINYYEQMGYEIIEWEIDSDFDSILEEALNSPIVPEVEKYGKELFSTKIYKYNDEKYIIIKKGNKILEFNKCED